MIDFSTMTIPWLQLSLIAFFYFSAWVIYRLSRRIAGRFLRLGQLAPRHRQPSIQRQATLRGLLADAVTFLAFGLATFASLSLFVDSSTLIWIVGLFSAGFGLGARPLVSDFLSGISFIFENTFEVGDKVQFAGLAGGEVEGVIEAVFLRTTIIRAQTGEPFTVPNGEIRVVRNFSRGRFSMADIKFKVNAEDLSQALPLLEDLGKDAVTWLPNLLEPWQVLSTTGEIGQQTELTVNAKARFGKAAEMRPRLLTLVQERFADAGIELAG